MNNKKIGAAEKRAIVLVLFCMAFFALFQPVRAERKGAELLVMRSDGHVLQGELIAVRGEELVLLVNGLDASASLGDIAHITIVKKSNVPMWSGIGFLAGGIIGYNLEQKAKHESSIFGSSPDRLRQYYASATWAVLMGGVGLAVGLILGADKPIPSEKWKTPEERSEVLKKLTALARMKSTA